MNVIPPNFISIRLLDADKENYAKLLDSMQRSVGIPLSTSDLYRMAIKALAEKHGVRGMQ